MARHLVLICFLWWQLKCCLWLRAHLNRLSFQRSFSVLLSFFTGDKFWWQSARFWKPMPMFGEWLADVTAVWRTSLLTGAGVQGLLASELESTRSIRTKLWQQRGLFWKSACLFLLYSHSPVLYEYIWKHRPRSLPKRTSLNIENE